MDVTNTTLISWSFGLAALGYLLLLVYLVSFSHDWRASVNARRMVIAATLSTLWALSALFALQYRQPLAFVTAALLDVTRYGAWFAFLLSVLLPRNGENKATSVGATWFPVACWTLVACGMLIQFALAAGWITPQDWLRTLILHGLAEAVMGLILVEQLFRSVAEDSRWNVKPLCLALLVQFVFDVYLFSDAMMFGQIDGDALSVRGFVHAMTVPLLMLTTERSKDWASKIRLSQKAAFHSVTLLFSGIYLLFMAGIGYYVRYFGGEWGRAFQLALVFAAILLLGILLVSGSMRAKMKVLVGKHFFHYRYDYREEWLRFTQTLTAQDSPQSMGEQVIRGLANMVESPAGIL